MTIISINSTTTTARIQKGFWLVRNETGVKIGGILIPILRFSDILVITKPEEGLQTALNVMNSTFKRKMQKIIWIEKRTNYDILKTTEEKRTLLDDRNDRRTQLRGRPRTKYISQIIQDAGTNTYRELKDMTSDRER
ncbi:Reverse transcriptase domain-containing protein [Aphis craccivora]|uniref:Reverse transcriptase domain-containing protein n=1 Tax=Aphis craccivora TaxID=307492 RepID=A0A6G0ZM41_APHCR|nr:Reverse transcriptase domain-containing protein [Aphis craccivora]